MRRELLPVTLALDSDLVGGVGQTVKCAVVEHRILDYRNISGRGAYRRLSDASGLDPNPGDGDVINQFWHHCCDCRLFAPGTSVTATAGLGAAYGKLDAQFMFRRIAVSVVPDSSVLSTYVILRRRSNWSFLDMTVAIPITKLLQESSTAEFKQAAMDTTNR